MMIIFECKAYSALCELEEFNINGIQADYEDFGTKKDTDPENAEPYSCGNMEFLPKPPTQEVLDKYNITTDDYIEVCNKLTDELSFGCCGWCV